MTIEGKKDRDKIFTLRPLLNRCFYVPEPKQKRAMGRMEDEEQPGLVLLPEGRNWRGTRQVERRGGVLGDGGYVNLCHFIVEHQRRERQSDGE
jgi:hypothetical protein